jgi:hypothetical protein
MSYRLVDCLLAGTRWNGGKAPETCWATHTRQVINLWNCCILLVDLFESYDDSRTCERRICECRDNGHREGDTFVMGVNEVTVQRVPWDRMAFWAAKSVYQVAGCTAFHPIHVEGGGTPGTRSCACMQAGTTRLVRYIGPSRASQCLSAVYSTSVAFHSRIHTAVNHVIMKLWLDHLGTIFKPYRESWDISRQSSSPHPLTCTDTIIPPSVRL